MKNSAIVLPLLAVTALSACNPSGPAGPPAGAVARQDAAVLVNGRPISKYSVENLEQEFSQRRGGEGVTKDKIIDELTKREILRQEAERENLLKDPSLAAKVDNAMRMVLSQAAAENLVKKFAPSEEEIKKEYEQRIGAMKSSEYKARHILVDSEAVAQDLIKRLQKGEDFAALAKKFSSDQGSKSAGGELGWFSPQQMVPPFSSAVVGLKNGEVTKAPVKSDYGWHVIQREESREQQAPAFEAVKDQLVSFMQSEKLHKYIEELQAKAKVERLLPAETKPAASSSETAPAAPAKAPVPAKP